MNILIQKGGVKVEIRQLQRNERPPMDLLMRAEPNQRMLQQKFRQGECYVIVDQNKFAGVYMLFTNENGCEIDMLTIHPQFEKDGLEKDLLLHAKETAKEKGQKTVRVTTSNANIEHIEILQKCGYRLAEVEKDYYLRSKGKVAILDDIPVLDLFVFEAKI